jgi:hypothetical protein
VSRVLGWTRAEGALLDVATLTLAAFALFGAFGHGSLGLALGAAAGLLLAFRWTRAKAARALQQGRPALGVALEAYLEGLGGSLRGRLEAWVTERLGPVWLPRSLGALGVATALAATSLALPHKALAVPPAPVVVPVLHVIARVEPPAYTGLSSVLAELPHVKGLRHSVVHLEVHASAPQLTVTEKGSPPRVVVPEGGRAELSFPLDRSRSVRLAGEEGGPVVLLELDVVEDEAPRVTLLAPEADRTVTAPPGKLALRASATDDVGLHRLGFLWTLASGQGEAMRFRSGSVGGQATLLGKTGEARAELDAVALGMKAGDSLVVWAEAADGNLLDGPGLGRSDVRILRWQEALVDFSGLAAGGSLPPAASHLSERELLVRTERLVRAHLSAVQRREHSTELAEVQRQLRESFGFSLQMESHAGPELDVENAEAAESGDARARRLLAQAVSEMWAAEAELAVGNPAGALAPERAAVKALDAAFGNERLALRALRPPDKPVDERLRLSGAQAGLRPRALSAAPGPARDTRAVEALARQLLLSAEHGVTAEEARALADALWALPTETGIPVSGLAAPLYAATDAVARRAASREAGVVLARWLRPSPEVVPPVSAAEASLLARLPLPPLPL